MNIRSYIKKHGGLFSKGSFDYLFFAFLLAIIVVGLLMLYSASYPSAYYYENDSTYYFFRQLQGVVLGFIMMMFISKINYRIFYDIGAYVGTGVSWILLIIARLIPRRDGIHRWINIGSFQFQPSDIAKFALILTLAMWLDKYHREVVSKKPLKGNFAETVNEKFGRPIINESLKPIIIAGGITATYTGLVIIGSHLSGAILMLSIGVIVMYLGEIRGKWFVAGIAGVSLLFLIAIASGLLKDYMSLRITAWLDKDFEPLGGRWQINQALYAIGSGGFAGKGLGQSTQKYLYVSEPQNDMIFSIVVEELGFIGAVVIMLLFALLIWRGVVIGINSTTRYGALVAMGIIFQFAIQLILNIAVATDTVPNTGISLPFFSYGRTAMVVNMAEMGMVLSISRSSRIKRR